MDNEINIVTLRRGIRDIDGCTYALCPDREGLPLFNFVKGCNVACRAYQLGYNTTVDCHRIAYLLSAYQRGVRMQFFAMTAFISRVLKIIPALFFACFKRQLRCGDSRERGYSVDLSRVHRAPPRLPRLHKNHRY